MDFSSNNLASPADHKTGPRICMPTARRLNRNAFRCGLYEAQDVLVETNDVELISLEAGSGFRFKESSLKRLLYHNVSKRVAFLNPGLKKLQLNQEYDLFVTVCNFYWDLPYINAVDRWREHCKVSVCWIDEIWATAIAAFKHWLHALSRFDYICIGQSGSVAPLSNAINRPVHWIAGAVDAIRFSPYPAPAPRVIDVYSIGRRWDGIHRALLEAASRKDILYVYDTFQGADAEVYDHQQHRELFANMAKRSKYFMVAPGKIGDPQAQGQAEIGYRYYEGAAAGAVMVGQEPDSGTFQKMFPWPDAVIPLHADGSDVLNTLACLSSEPQRLAAISQRNAAESLLRHDWVYRWKEIFQIAGIEPSSGMKERERRLKELANLANRIESDEELQDRVI